jgi:ferredoxin-NADP reductase
MTVVVIGGTNGLLSQETVRIILALVLSDQDDIGCGAQSAKATDKNCSGGSGWKGFFMTTYQSRLRGREEVAEGTMAFHLEKPAGFQFKAGQYVDVSLINPPETDSEGMVRSFSIASAPYEGQLLLVTRMRKSAFKRVLAILPLGMKLKLEGPMGSFTLHKNRVKAAVFLAGGIGITPFLSMLREAAEERLPQRLYLFYSNRHPKDAAFLKDLEILSKVNANFVFIPSMSEEEKSSLDWPNERGFIDREMLLRHMDGLKGPIYYVAGPPAMVAAMREMLTHAGVEEDDIRTEEFGGY